MYLLHYHLAQINIARMIAPLDSPVMAGFVAQLEPVNTLADRSPGLIWRLPTESGDATSVQAYPGSACHREHVGLGIRGSASGFCL